MDVVDNIGHIRREKETKYICHDQSKKKKEY